MDKVFFFLSFFWMKIVPLLLELFWKRIENSRVQEWNIWEELMGFKSARYLKKKKNWKIGKLEDEYFIGVRNK